MSRDDEKEDRELWDRFRSQEPALPNEPAGLDASYQQFLSSSDAEEQSRIAERLFSLDSELASMLDGGVSAAVDPAVRERIVSAIEAEFERSSTRSMPASNRPWASVGSWGVLAASVALAASLGMWAGSEVSQAKLSASQPPSGAFLLDGGQSMDSLLVLREVRQ